MKIGILTFQFADNYGALLQAYALKKYLELCSGGKVEIINYVNKNFKHAYSINPVYKIKKGVLPFVKAVIRYPVKYRQFHKFNCFRKNLLSIKDKVAAAINFEKFDCIVAGSDQIWNQTITFGDMNYFLPREKEGCARISYAASADDAFPPDENREKIGKALANFSGISVREAPLQKKLEDVYKLESTLVADPVFLLDKEFWHSFGQLPKRMPPEYILYYVLKENTGLEREAEALSAATGLPVVVIHPTGRKMCKCGSLRFDVGPHEFVALIKNARYVVSNSFHAFAFSTIFSKDIVFDCLAGSADRIHSLLAVLGNEPQGNSAASVQLVKINEYNSEKFQQFIAGSKEFLKESLAVGRG